MVLRCICRGASNPSAAEGIDRRGLAAKKLPRYVHGRLPAQQAAVVGAEAAAQAALCAASPSILRLVDVRQDDSSFYLIQERCLMDLRAWLRPRGGAPLSGREVACIVQQLLCALAACHRAGIAFRDVKPANLLVREIGADGLPELALADFGCCRSTADPPPASHTSAGTPLYRYGQALGAGRLFLGEGMAVEHCQGPHKFAF